MFLALSGHRLKGADNLHAGIATHLCPSERLSDLKSDLLSSGAKSDADVAAIIDSYQTSFPGLDAPFGLEDKLALIDSCFSGDSVEEVMARLGSEGGDWGKKVNEGLRKMSPMSVKITFR